MDWNNRSQFADILFHVAKPVENKHPVTITVDGGRLFAVGVADFQHLSPGQEITAPHEAGLQLLQALLCDSKNSNVELVWREAMASNRNRRIRLQIDPAATGLSHLPWELLRDAPPKGPPVDLTASAATPFSRFQPVERDPGVTPKIRRLRVLVAIGGGENLAKYSLTPIDEDVEWNILKQTTANLAVDLVRLKAPCSIDRIAATLSEGYHVVHIVAHGRLNAKSGEAAIFLADDQNQAVPVAARQLTEVFGNVQTARDSELRLLFLASCQTALPDESHVNPGLAPQMLQAGTPAVLAMKGQVPVDTARAFTHHFYRSLLQDGVVDLAANRARSILFARQLSGADRPILFSRLPEGQLFRIRRWDRIIGVAAALAIVAALVVAYLIVNPPPMPEKSYNLAVAEVAILGEDGHLTRDTQARAFSRMLADELSDERKAPGLANAFRGPRRIGMVGGSDDEARLQSAMLAAEKHRASILVYGVIRKTDNEYWLQPEFYISPDQTPFTHGSEFTGVSRLGAPVPIQWYRSDQADSMDVFVAASAALKSRIGALQHLISGLGELYAGDFDEAYSQFGKAKDQSQWESNDGLEIIDLMQGAAQLRAFSHQQDPDIALGHLAIAENAFEKSCPDNSDDLNTVISGRACVGRGSVDLLRAYQYDDDHIGILGVDEPSLLKAIDWYARALSIEASSDIAPTERSHFLWEKASYGIGAATLLGFEHLDPAQWDAKEAWDIFTEIIERYERQPSVGLASRGVDSYVNLGRLAGHNGDWPLMIDHIITATNMIEDGDAIRDLERLARYNQLNALAHERMCQYDEAADLYTEAIRLTVEDKEGSPPSDVVDYCAKQQALPQQVQIWCETAQTLRDRENNDCGVDP